MSTNTKVIRRDKHSVSREVLKGVADIRSALDVCRTAEVVALALPGNSMAQSRYANACAMLSSVATLLLVLLLTYNFHPFKSMQFVQHLPWIQNAGILRWYVERKGRRNEQN